MNRPIIAGVSIRGDTWRIASKNGLISLPSINDSFMELHAVLIVSYDKNESLIKFANSWGKNWGDNGFGYMKIETARLIIRKDQMWAVEVVQ